MANTPRSMFVYTWFIDPVVETSTVIRAYGLGPTNENICLVIRDFCPYVYIELDPRIKWEGPQIKCLKDIIQKILKNLPDEWQPTAQEFVMRYRMFGAHVDPMRGERKKFPYLLCTFGYRKHPVGAGKKYADPLRRLSRAFEKPQLIHGWGAPKLAHLKVHEGDADPILQLACCRGIPPVGWISFCGQEVTDDNSYRETYCDEEYIVKHDSLKAIDMDYIPKPKIMAFDIEVNSSVPAAMPDPSRCEDCVFQISCVFYREGEKYKKVLISLGDPDPLIVGQQDDPVEILACRTEGLLFETYAGLIKREQPNIITGYNILTFDIDYMLKRITPGARSFGSRNDFLEQGFRKDIASIERTAKWSSSAYRNNEYSFLDVEGRLFVDMLPIIKRDHKLDNYRLKTVSTHFLGESKDPLTPQGIFKCYRIGMDAHHPQREKAMGIVGKYCIVDSVLVGLLFDKLKTWVSLCEMAKTCNVPIDVLCLRGQQIKVYSQVYKYCTDNGIVVEKDGYDVKENEHYQGAYVFDPVPGCYDIVLPFDFASLYPTTIIAYNIDYSTWVQDDDVPDDVCHVMEWEDHVGCEHDPKVRQKEALTEVICSRIESVRALRLQRAERLPHSRTKKESDAEQKRIFNPQIKALERELKEFRTQRAEVAKTKPKYPMCETRRYRFLKEPPGILPTIIQALLDKRKAVRKGAKEMMKIDRTGMTDRDVLALETQLDILEKRQLSYKISANSMYGIMGAQKGYLPFMPGAMCTTFKGRENIGKVADTIVKVHGGNLIYGDSVTEDTPVLCRIGGVICYRTIDDLPHDEWVEYKDHKEEAAPSPDLEIWTETGFTAVKRVIRHKTDKEIFRVLTHTGVVDVTEDHGLLNLQACKVSPKDIDVGYDLMTHDLPPPMVSTLGDADLAFVQGLFYADGSCGIYHCRTGLKATWALNNLDMELLAKCQTVLKNVYTSLDFKILDTLQSSGVYKLVCVGKTVRTFVREWRQQFYDIRRLKKVPDFILVSSSEVRRSFLDGYYAGDGDKDKYGYYRFDNKGKIGSAGLYYLAVSLGYRVSINTRNDKPDVYRMTCTKGKQRRSETAVKKLVSLGRTQQYVYDLETENHHFSAGIGKLIVHNTDSNYISFPGIKTAHEAWDRAVYVADEVTKLFPSAIKLEFEEEIYWRFFILTKKRYMYKACKRDGMVSDKIGRKGVVLARRDNCALVRNLYEEIIRMIFDRVERDEVLYTIIRRVNELCSNSLPTSDFVITKAVGSFNDLQAESAVDEKGVLHAKVGDYKAPILSHDEEERANQLASRNARDDREYYLKCLPPPVQLAVRMQSRGERVDAGSRLEFVVTDEGGHGAKQGVKIEDSVYFERHKRYLNMDFLYYLKQLVNPIDQVLNTAYGNDTDCGRERYCSRRRLQKSEREGVPGGLNSPVWLWRPARRPYPKDFVFQIYLYRSRIREKVMCELRAYFQPTLRILDNDLRDDCYDANAE